MNDIRDKIAYLDLSKNTLGDEGLALVTNWIQKESINIYPNFKPVSINFGQIGQLEKLDIKSTELNQ